jgi:hypothetical protein
MEKINFDFIVKNKYYIITAAVIAAVFMVAYFNGHKVPVGGGGIENLQEGSSLPNPTGKANNIGTSEGDGTVAPLSETEIGGATNIPAASSTAINANLSAGKVCLGNNCYVVELAITPSERERGLMFRSSLGKDRGMLFDFGADGIHKFWMKNTLINLDIIWIGADKKIVFISNNISPCIRDVCPSYGPDAAARYVLEVNGGEMKRLGAKIGDAAVMNF